ncbi:MAG TPA: imidazole glycerol phosphate synthase subunit HisH [Thermotogota bacterium]|nr:imidazole glycerol phosphate synthase subunit HisH [Thermotogota bacterium]HRW91530.1 imidazole glycerol phosphate synthase subunit HisH [Thermotogota bacterium]
MASVGILHLGMGNLSNVQRATGGEIVEEPHRVKEFSRLVLPGVGSYSAVSAQLERFRDALQGARQGGVPMLGICLGMQLLFSSSQEGPGQGLGWADGDVLAFPTEKAPHIGWNQVWWERAHPLGKGLGEGSFFYFVHGYFCHPQDPQWQLTRTDYHGEAFCSAVVHENVAGVQFHPEKSSREGEILIQNFLRWTP